MSTPSSQSHSQAQKPPPAASTPTPSSFPHPPFSSPAARSVPSPAAHRATHPAGKSPFPNPTSTPAPTSTFKPDTPALKPDTPQSALKYPPTGANVAKEKLGASLGATGSPASHGLGALDFTSPSALQLSLSSQGVHLDGTGSSGGVGMGLSISGMGISGLGLSNMGMGARLDDEERRRRLERVIAMLGTQRGRVGEEGVERVCRRNGWATLWDDRREGGRTLTGAGTNVLVDVDFVGKDGVEKVAVTVHEAGEHVKSTVEQAGRVLLADLTEGRSTLDKKLDQFASNLDRLARLDKLSRTQEGLNCFDALAGIYTSLQRLYEHQFKAAAELFREKPDAVQRAEREVLCRKSGRPKMHARRMIGLNLDYWQCRKAEEPSRVAKYIDDGRNRSTADVHPSKDSGTNIREDNCGIFTINIEVEASPATLYPSIRASNHWISDTVEKQSDDNPANLDESPNEDSDQPIIDWQEPPPMYLASTSTGTAGGNTDAMVLDTAAGGLGKLPDVRFVAKLSPPVAVPLYLAAQMLSQVGLSIAQEPIRPINYELLAIQRPLSSRFDVSAAIDRNAVDTVVKTIRIPSFAKGEDIEIEHQYSLDVSSASTEYGRFLEEIPFSHPRQIIQFLPILRQYAFLSRLLQSAFANPQSSMSPFNEPQKPNGEFRPPIDDLDFISGIDGVEGHQNRRSSSHHIGANISRPIKVGLTLGIPPSIVVSFPIGRQRDARIIVEVQPNAEVDIQTQDLLPSPTQAATESERQELGNEQIRRARQIARALEISGDLGIWVEWMKRTFGEVAGQDQVSS